MASNGEVRGRLQKLLSPELGSNAQRVVSQIFHWETYKGPEWVATRLKKQYQAALLVLNGDLLEAAVLLKDSGIATRGDAPWRPKGPWGNIFLDLRRTKSGSKLRRKLATLRCYTGIYLPKASKKQFSKAKSCITGRGGEGRIVSLVPPCTSQIQDCGEPLSLEGLSGISKYFSGKYRVSKEMSGRPFASMLLSLATVGDVPSSAIELLGDCRMRREAFDFQTWENIPGYGRITFLQEGGAKGRVVCLPSAWMQVYFRPLHRILMRVIQSLESRKSEQMPGWSCVLDQNVGAYQLQRWVRERRSTWCFDLRSATDRFPRSVQLQLLRQLGLSHWERPVQQACEGRYWCNLANSYWSYKVGQPMGLAGSFPLFHLTHYSLLSKIAERHHAKDCFLVLGDDVVISHKGVAESYREEILNLGVELSEEKSYGGGNLTEFAGFLVIRREDGSSTVFRPYKHGQGWTFRSKEVNLCHALGRKVRAWGPWWSRMYDLYRNSCTARNPDLSPLAPEAEELGTYATPTSRWFLSLFQGLFRDPEGIQPSCRKDVSEMEIWGFMRLAQVNDLATPEKDTFDPKQYLDKEYLRKRTQFSADALIKRSLKKTS